MRPRDIIELLFLSLLWGGAYLSTRATVPAFGPARLVSLRLGIAALILLPIWPGARPPDGRVMQPCCNRKHSRR